MTQIVTLLPNTGFVRPTSEEIASLLKIVAAAHRDIATQIDAAEFERAFFACGYMFRTAAPRQDRYFTHFLDVANTFLRDRWGVEGVSGGALFLAVRAHADIPWRAAGPMLGQLLEAGLDEHHGLRLRQPNAWVGLLKGGNLLSPTPPDPQRRQQVERGPARTYQQNPDGSFRVVGDYESLW